MTTIIRLLCLLAGVLLALASCKKSDDAGNGLSERLRRFEKTACAGATVTRYDFRGAPVFVFADSCAYSDAGFMVTDANGVEICFLGGFGGLSHCRGAHFDSTARSPSVVYNKS